MKTPSPPESKPVETPSPGAALPARAAPGGDPSGSSLPQRFGKYTLLRKLATGGMAELFLALQKSVAGFEKLVVIKRILPRMNQDRAFIDMLLHEARIAATLSHPNVVQVFDVGQVDGTYFIAMEHVHGEDIRSIARQMRRTTQSGPREFPREHALSIVLGVCSGLAYAHEKRDFDGTALNIVHRDVSPQNVVVTFSGDIKLVDFGIAKSDRGLHPETRSGKLRGKVPYMSPEQARGEELDARSDIFSTGVILFELTTGRRLFKSASEYETLKLICERDYPKPAQIVPDYPRELEAIVMRALARNRDERFGTAREMQAALEDFVRCEQMMVSPIALQRFMHSLFADKLVSQKEALLHGKLLAEAINRSSEGPSSEGPSNDGPSSDATGVTAREYVGAHLSTPAASSHTVTSTLPKSGSRLPWAVACAATIALLVVLFGTTFYAKRSAPVRIAEAPSASQAPATAGPSPEAIVPSLSPSPPSESPPPEPIAAAASPVRPTATAPKASSHAAAANGKLNVAAAGGWCTVTVDGKPFGPTPVAAIELPAGPHKVVCTAAGGKTLSATVHVPSAGVARHRFNL